MGTFAELLPTIIPAAESIISDIVSAVQAKSQPAAAPGTLSGQVATTITNATGFASSVSNKDQTGAANAAAAVVPTITQQAASTGAASALGAVSSAQKQLGEQLTAVAQLLIPCYFARDYMFAISQAIAGKQSFTTEDQALLKAWWVASDTQIKTMNGAAAQLATITDEYAKDQFQAVIAELNNPSYSETATTLSSIGAGAAPVSVIVYTEGLLDKLRMATLVAQNAMNQFASALNQTAQSAQASQAMHLAFSAL